MELSLLKFLGLLKKSKVTPLSSDYRTSMMPLFLTSHMKRYWQYLTTSIFARYRTEKVKPDVLYAQVLRSYKKRKRRSTLQNPAFTRQYQYQCCAIYSSTKNPETLDIAVVEVEDGGDGEVFFRVVAGGERWTFLETSGFVLGSSERW